jgi:hypothetical protein
MRITERFRTRHNQVLVSTDASAEGLNLQERCYHLIHAELPWNPNRLEQRNGRTGRYGQTHSARESDARPLCPAPYLQSCRLRRALARAKDRDGIFANHRCRFLVPDEVHTYRGTLGTYIALLVRRLQAHLARARQDWHTEVSEADRLRWFPKLLMVGTSATIETPDEKGMTREQALAKRDEEVRDFFAKLTGAERATIRVLGEELKEVATRVRLPIRRRPWRRPRRA